MREMDKSGYIPPLSMYQYKGKWYKIQPKPYEPERQTVQVAWAQIKGSTPEKAYRDYFAKLREDAQILYPSFRKDDN
jgi:hypothetical protein